MESGFDALRIGATLVLAGNLPKGQKIEIDPFKFIEGCRVRGVVGGDCSHEDILEFASRKDIWKPLISRNYSFEQLDVAIKDLAAGTIIKPIIECQK
jgi:Zn-dependent alcohol dehydrogenase